jgi:hypothetical protein
LFNEYSETVSKSNPPSKVNAIKYLVDHGIHKNEAEVKIHQHWNAYDWKMIVEGPSMFDDVDYIDGSDVPTSGFYESKANEDSYPSPMISKGQQYTKDSFLGFKGHNPTIAICKKCGWEAGALNDKWDNASQDTIPPNQPIYDKIREHVASVHGLVRSSWAESYVRKAKYTGNEGISLADWSKYQDEHGWYRVGVSSPTPDIEDIATSMGGDYYGMSSSGYDIEEWSFHNYSDAENFAQYVEGKTMEGTKEYGIDPMEAHYVEGPSDVSPIVFSGGQSHNIGSGAIGGHPLRDNPFGTESKKVNKRRRGA